MGLVIDTERKQLKSSYQIIHRGSNHQLFYYYTSLLLQFSVFNRARVNIAIGNSARP